MITAMFEAWYSSLEERIAVAAMRAYAGLTAGLFLLAFINPEFLLPALLVFGTARQWYEFEKSIRQPECHNRLQA